MRTVARRSMGGGLLAAPLLLGNAQIAGAQESASGSDLALRQDLTLADLLTITTVTASKREQKVADAPAMVVVVTDREIRERGYSTLKDIFHDLPGMGVHENFFSESGTLVAVRGIQGNNKIITLVNGIRVNPPGNEHQPIRSDISVRFAKQVEIIYGPGSTLYGNDAISMVVNIITRDVSDSWVFDAQAIGGAGNATSDPGKHLEGFAGAAKRFGQGDGLGLSAYVHWQLADLDDFKNTYPNWYELYQDRDGGNSSSIERGAYRKDLGANVFLKLEGDSGSITFWHRESARSSSEGGFTPVLQYVPEAVWHDRTTVVEARHQYAATDDVTLDSSLTASRYEVDPVSRYVFNAAPGERLFLRDWKYGTGTGVQLEEKVTYRALDELVFVGGAAVYHRNILPKASVNRSDEAEIDADEIGADTSVDILSQGQSFSWFEDSADERVSVSNYTLFVYQNYAAYLEGQWDATPQLTVVGGLRVDKDSRYDDLPLSPRVAAIFHANENLAIKGIYTQAFVNPAPYFSFASFNGTNFNVPNPDLKPELAQSIELNTSYTLSWLLSGLSVYYNLQDRILFHADDGLRFQLLRDGQGDPNDSDPSARPVYRNVDEDGNLIDPAGVSQSVNGGESSAFGFDLYGKLRLDLASLWASYSYVNFESKDTDGNTVGLDALAEQQVRLGVTMRFFEERLTTTVSGQWSSTLERLDGNNAKADPNDASEVGRLDAEVKNPYSVNAYLSYKVLNELSASLMAKNVTDNRYALKGILGPSPQESIKILAGLRYTLD